jgi:hypothetical protein
MAPSWEGIIPGKTNYIDAAKALTSNRLFYQVVIPQPLNEMIDNYQLSFRWVERQTDNVIIPHFGDALFDRESEINTCIRIPINPIELSELFTIIGEPTKIYISPIYIPGSEDDTRWDIQLVYIEKGILLSRPLTMSNSVEKDLTMNKIIFFIPTEIGFDRATLEGKHLQLRPWMGYGLYGEEYMN